MIILGLKFSFSPPMFSFPAVSFTVTLVLHGALRLPEVFWIFTGATTSITFQNVYVKMIREYVDRIWISRCWCRYGIHKPRTTALTYPVYPLSLVPELPNSFYFGSEWVYWTQACFQSSHGTPCALKQAVTVFYPLAEHAVLCDSISDEGQGCCWRWWSGQSDLVDLDSWRSGCPVLFGLRKITFVIMT